MDNIALCNDASESLIQQIIHAIESGGKHVRYLQLLQTLLKAENQLIRKTQDTIMAEVLLHSVYFFRRNLLSASGYRYLGSPFGRYPTYHALTSVGQKTFQYV